jgi:hypothetical protein
MCVAELLGETTNLGFESGGAEGAETIVGNESVVLVLCCVMYDLMFFDVSNGFGRDSCENTVPAGEGLRHHGSRSHDGVPP